VKGLYNAMSYFRQDPSPTSCSCSKTGHIDR
jgi:hypothetical protein